MSRIVSVGIIIIACWFGWKGYQYWASCKSEQGQSQAEQAQAAVAAINPRNLPGIPDNMKAGLENALDKAQQIGAPGLREWLKAYKKYIADPRLAWIELDYAVLVATDNPAEAKRVFNDVKERTPPTSPIYPRIRQLEKTYQ